MADNSDKLKQLREKTMPEFAKNLNFVSKERIQVELSKTITSSPFSSNARTQ